MHCEKNKVGVRELGVHVLSDGSTRGTMSWAADTSSTLDPLARYRRCICGIQPHQDTSRCAKTKSGEEVCFMKPVCDGRGDWIRLTRTSMQNLSGKHHTSNKCKRIMNPELTNFTSSVLPIGVSGCLINSNLATVSLTEWV